MVEEEVYACINNNEVVIPKLLHLIRNYDSTIDAIYDRLPFGGRVLVDKMREANEDIISNLEK